MIFENILSFLFDKWTAIWLICRRLFLERAWSGLMTFFEEKWNNHSIFLWCRNRGPKCFLLFWQKLKWQMISIWKCGKNASCKLLNFAVCLHSSNVFIYDIMYRVNHYWCLESIHTLLLSQSIPFYNWDGSTQ